VHHFGDLAGAREACGLCDFCSPATCEAQQFRVASAAERNIAGKILDALDGADGRSTGKLHSGVCPRNELDRDQFEQLLGAMATAGIIELTEETFEAEGREIHFRKASITREGLDALQAGVPDLMIKQAPEKKKGKKGKKKASAKPARATKGRGRTAAADPDLSKIEQALRAWRVSEAKKRRVPAFRILTDKVLLAIASDRPRDESELGEISGIGPKLIEKYGAQLLRIVSQS